MKKTNKALIMSVLSLVLCIAMLVGTTFAWFTDSVTSGTNQIVAGNLDVEVQYSKNGTDWDDLKGSDSLFSSDLWEPGHTEVVYLKVSNAGTLAFNYKVNVSPVSESSGINKDGESFLLSDYLVFGTTAPSATDIKPYSGREAAQVDITSTATKLDQTALEETGVLYSTSDTNIPAGGSTVHYFALVVYMPTTVGNEANYKTGTTPPSINLGITVTASQEDHESDSFGTDYDAGQDPSGENDYSYIYQYEAESAQTDYDTNDGAYLEAKDSASNIRATADVPAGETVNGDIVLDAEDDLSLKIVPEETGNVTVGTGQGATTYDVSMLYYADGTDTPVKVTALSKPALVKLEIGVVDLQEFYHKETKLTKSSTVTSVADVANLETNKYFYDQSTGFIYYYASSFSPFTSVYEFGGGLGTSAYPYLISDKAQLQHISDKYDTYYCYKVAGISTMDCTGWTPVYLHGSFDGSGISFTNLTACLFKTVGYKLANEEITLKNFSATMKVSAPQEYGAAALVKEIFNSGTTTFDSVNVHGVIEGYWNIGSFYNYGPANYDDKGADYTVNFVNSKSDATLICTSSNTCGGFLGHGFEGKGHVQTLNVDEDSEYTGTIYTTGGDGGHYIAMNSTGSLVFNGVTTSRYAADFTSYGKNVKINAVAPVKGDNGYTVAAAEGVARILVTVTGQLSAYESDNTTAIANLSGITMTFDSTTITEGITDDVKVLDNVDSAVIVNNAKSYSSSISDGVLTLNVAQEGANYRTGTARLTVTQYDADGNILCCGTTNLYTIENSPS